MNDLDLVVAAWMLALFVVALAVGWLLAKLPAFRELGQRSGRYDSLDGLRGYLALMVFVHHFGFTYVWKTTGHWMPLDSTLALNLGKVGVAIFFMISGFLFIQKTLSAQRIDWSRLYCGRVFRIYPLYFFALFIMTVFVLIQTDFVRQVTLMQLAQQYFGWLVFSHPNINELPETANIIAGVQWTLRYEWFFYLMLPIVGVIIRNSRLATAQLLLIVGLMYFQPITVYAIDTRYLILFAIGGVTAGLTHIDHDWKKLFNRPIFSVLGLATISFSLFVKDLSLMQVTLLALFFIPTALGNSLFGLLRLRASVLLGEISYSIYLLHGLVLYTIFTLIAPHAVPDSLDAFFPWMPLLGIVVVLISAGAYLLVEKPGIHIGRRISQLKLRSEKK